MSITLPPRLVALLVAVPAVLAGCGGGPAEPTLYAVEPTQACLEEAGIPVRTEGLDFVATTALAGALHGDLGQNEVTVALGQTDEEAQRIEGAYQSFAGERIPIEHVLMRDRNAVLLWNAPPSGEDRARVVACLRG